MSSSWAWISLKRVWMSFQGLIWVMQFLFSVLCIWKQMLATPAIISCGLLYNRAHRGRLPLLFLRLVTFKYSLVYAKEVYSAREPLLTTVSQYNTAPILPAHYWWYGGSDFILENWRVFYPSWLVYNRCVCYMGCERESWNPMLTSLPAPEIEPRSQECKVGNWVYVTTQPQSDSM